MPPLVGWAAATGGLTLEALIPFAIVFLWTPPHFWALALLISDDYERTGVPMLPVVRGADFTRRPDPRLLAGPRRLHPRAVRDRDARRPLPRRRDRARSRRSSALAARLLREPSKRAALQLYLSSLAYLFLLFGAMAADRVMAV